MRTESPGHKTISPLHERGKSGATGASGWGWGVARLANGEPFITAWLLGGILRSSKETDVDVDQVSREITGLLAEVHA